MRSILFFAALLWAFAAQSAGLNQIGSFQGSVPFYWNFINSQSLPPAWTLARAACTGSVAACVTNAQYNDAAGAPYTTYIVNHPVFSSRGIGAFEGRTNYLFPSETPTTTTTGTIPTGYYVLICNGSGSILSAAVTGTASGLGTLNCGSTYQTFQVTVAGTFIFTVTGTVNWADVQGPCVYANAACGPTPHIITTSGTSTRPSDVITLAAPQGQLINRGPSSVALEYYSTSSSTSNEILVLGSTSNGAYVIAPIDAGNSSKCTSALNNVASLATSGSNQALFTTNRVAGTNNPKIYALSCNGGASTNSSTATATTSTISVLGAGGGSYYCNCWVSQMKIWPLILPNSALQYYSTAGVPF